MNNWFKTVLGLGFISLMLAACSSASGTPPAKWASNYCSSMYTWYSQAQNDTNGFESLIHNQTDPSQIKTEAQNFLQGEVSQLQALQSKVKANGSPSVADGTKLHNLLTLALTKYGQVLQGAQNTLAPISTSSITNLANVFEQIGTSLDSAQRTLGKTLLSIGQLSTSSSDQPLAQALNSNKYCKTLQASK